MKLKQCINECLKLLGIAFLIESVWEFIELIIYGEITPRNVDTIIAAILLISLYGNLRAWDKGQR